MNPNDSNVHPAAEAWAAWLYEELPPAEQARLAAHLPSCPECQAAVDAWQTTLQALDTWTIPARTRRRTRWFPVVRWAAAAVVILGAGLIAGRVTAPRVDTTQLRALVRQELQSDFQAALKTVEQANHDRLDALAQDWSVARERDRQANLALHQQGERQHRADYVSLRRDLETVAVVAENAIGTTRQQLTQLAANTLPANGGGH